MTTTLTFHGAAQTVTGSKYLLKTSKDSVLVDCGMFQGLKELRLKNWQDPPLDAKALPAVALTHTHIDHCGYLPRLVRHGFRGKVLCTPATADLLPIVLTDAAKLQLEDAVYFNKEKLTRHNPAEPLFTEEDVVQAMRQLQPVEYGQDVRLGSTLSLKFLDVGHILGSAMIQATAVDEGKTSRVLFSGDVGRFDMPLTPDPAPLPGFDYLVIESTYGNRLHPDIQAHDQLEKVVKMVVSSHGILLIPAFAVGRTQQLLFILRELENARRIPELPIHVDSPMAFNTTGVYMKYMNGDARLMDTLKGGGTILSKNVKLHKSQLESRRLADLKGPAIILSSSGMMAGGRILHHARNFLPRSSTVLALAGYQAEGTRGRVLLEGKPAIRIFGQEVQVRAKIVDMDGFSGHADADELMRWLAPVQAAPSRVFVTHGEVSASNAFADRLRKERGWDILVPALGQEVPL